jgi:hypothetical protein
LSKEKPRTGGRGYTLRVQPRVAYKPHALGLELQSGERHAGMYAHDSRSRVTSIEWITIHVLSEVRVMTYSFQAAYLPTFM